MTFALTVECCIVSFIYIEKVKGNKIVDYILLQGLLLSQSHLFSLKSAPILRSDTEELCKTKHTKSLDNQSSSWSLSTNLQCAVNVNSCNHFTLVPPITKVHIRVTILHHTGCSLIDVMKLRLCESCCLAECILRGALLRLAVCLTHVYLSDRYTVVPERGVALLCFNVRSQRCHMIRWVHY